MPANTSTNSRSTPGSIFRSPQHGPLPALLYGLTVITGIVDAVSILGLGRVFVANMTGDIVFIGLAAAGAPGFSLGASLIALAGFLIGAQVGGRLISTRGTDRGTLFAASCVAELTLMTLAFIAVLVFRSPASTSVRYILSVLLALAMGIQNAVVRRLAVPDLTTTVLTMTLTGIAADIRQGGWKAPQLRRRALAVLAMLSGAVAGALLVVHISITPALLAVTVVMGIVTVGAQRASRTTAAWRQS